MSGLPSEENCCVLDKGSKHEEDASKHPCLDRCQTYWSVNQSVQVKTNKLVLNKLIFHLCKFDATHFFLVVLKIVFLLKIVFTTPVSLFVYPLPSACLSLHCWRCWPKLGTKWWAGPFCLELRPGAPRSLSKTRQQIALRNKNKRRTRYLFTITLVRENSSQISITWKRHSSS